MKELGEYLKENRDSNGINLDEAAEDLNISVVELENIEAGNTRAFKDIYALRDMIKKYAKYLGLDVKKVSAEFNDFLFEHTSKISIEDIVAAKSKKEEEDRKSISSPYTKGVRRRAIDTAPIVLCVLVFILILLVIYLIASAISNSSVDKKSTELKSIKEEVRYEFTY